MSSATRFRINLEKKFPHLNRAPIVEAVIDLRAAVAVAWEESTITEILKPKLPEYPKKQSMSGFQQQVTLAPGTVPAARTIDTGWTGLRVQTEDGLQIAQFNRSGFVFSRLRPYEEWERLLSEAMHLWEVFASLGQPPEIQRIGVRFINRIDLSIAEVDLDDYLRPAPEGARELRIPCRHFFYADAFGVPGHPYAINRIRTSQPVPGLQPETTALVLDIDVSTTEPSPLRRDLLEQRLTEMRWLKNKMFFGSIAPNALEAFR